MTEQKVRFDLDFSFFEYLRLFYNENKGIIRRNYRAVTKKYLVYNDSDMGAYLRKPQFEALEIYVFIKEYLNNAQMFDIFKTWYEKSGKFKGRSDIRTLSDDQLAMFGGLDAEQYQKVFQQYEAFSQNYSNYIYALSMGTGKTILMATCIFYEFILANKHPNDKLYCHNALVFAPDKTVLQSLKEIQTFDKSLVVPPEYLNWLETHLQFHYLDESGLSLNTIDKSKYNIVISNTQKIILKKKSAPRTKTEELFDSGKSSYKTQGIYAEIEEELEDSIITEVDLTVNQRFLKLIRLQQLGIYVDEAHHAFGAKLKSDFGIKKTATSLRLTINEIASNIEKAGSSVVACYNYTGTPYIGKHILPEVVYTYGLKKAIDNKYLKKVKLHSYTNPVSKEFIDIVIDDFWGKFGGDNRYDGMLPKLAIFSATIDELEEELRPLVEEAMSRHKIPLDNLLVNVGDPKLTTNDDIRNFNNLDTPDSNKQFILLVNKGREGWNCKSLFGVALYRKPRSKIFVLQATMRCLREIGPVQETGQVYLSDENTVILNKELEENFRLSADDLTGAGTKKKKYSVKLVPPKVYMTLKRVKKLHKIKELNPKNIIHFGLDKVDIEKYKLLYTEKEGLSPVSASRIKRTEDITHLRIKRKFSSLSLVSEISRYLNRSCLEIETILSNSKEGIKVILEHVNQYNELLYDEVIPKLFRHLYELEEYEHTEEEEIDLAKLNEEDELFFQADPENVIEMSDGTFASKNKKSFHINPYCFDSKPEKQLFIDLMIDTRVKKIYFTGMLTHGQSEFYIQYIDPESSTVRSYYPDFLIKKEDGSWMIIEVKRDDKIDDPVVMAKKEFADQLAKANFMTYRVIKGTDAANSNYDALLN